ncbi:MAG: hypothetical protein ACI33S_03110 [Bacilli bacterium]
MARKSVIKKCQSIKLDITCRNNFISFSGYSDYTLQVLGDVTVDVVITDTKNTFKYYYQY